ncbi:hypothetical protein F4815DRAFT_346174 [Daldinia loculata]|nr:hypothetical protein F4815DRAFT_346174 [Daldinia loculata]
MRIGYLTYIGVLLLVLFLLPNKWKGSRILVSSTNYIICLLLVRGLSLVVVSLMPVAYVPMQLESAA